MDDQPIDVVDPPEPASALTLRQPGVPITLSDLAALKAQASEVIAARIEAVNMLRLAAIRATFPSDWLLFRSPDGLTTGYLQDCGADRVRDFFGISITNIGRPEKIPGADGSFTYVIEGAGYCALTGQTIEHVEGARSSTDDFCAGQTGAHLELSVRKAARANLDGGITRALTGLQSIPIEALERAWQGTPKTIDQCRKGRGFGSQQERAGGERPGTPNLTPPVCAICGATAVYRTSARGGFWGCPEFKKHESRKWSMDAKEWEKNPRSALPTVGGAAAPDYTPTTWRRDPEHDG